MKFLPEVPPREFTTGVNNNVTIKDCGRMTLMPDEQISLETETGAELDVTRKNWGFYATPSLNKRLISFDLHGVLVRNVQGHYFVLLVETLKRSEFDKYAQEHNLELILWLDDGVGLDKQFLRAGER